MNNTPSGNYPNRYGSDSRFLMGALLIAIGLVLIAVNLNVLSYEMTHVLISWPMLLVVVGLFNLARRSYTPGYILLALGLFFLTPRILDVPENFYRNFWPAVLIAIGFIFMFQRKNSSRHSFHWKENHSSGDTVNAPTPDQSAWTVGSNDYIDETAILGGRNFALVSDHFAGGKITAVLGGFNINLLNCTPAAGCTIDLVNILGGTKLIVPPDWNIKMEVTAVAGGFEDKRKSLSREIDPSKTVIVKGTCILGGGEITSFL